MIWRNIFFGETKFFIFPHCAVEISEIYSHWKNISSNHLFSNFFSKTITFTNFCQKCVRVNSRNFHTVYCGHFDKKIVKATFLFNSRFHELFVQCTQCKKYANFFQKIRILKFLNFWMNDSPTIRWDYDKFKNIIRSTTISKTEALQFA